MRTGREAWPGSLLSFLLLVAATAVVSAISWPGHMNWDTMGTFHDAASGHNSGWHSAIWTAMWRGLLLIGLRSPGWMLAGGVMMLLVGLYLLLRACMSRSLALIAAVVVLVFPPVLSFSIVIGTDSWFAGSILCAFGFASRSARTQGSARSVSAGLAVVFGFLAQAARPTALPAVLALLSAIALVMLGPAFAGWRRVLAVIAIGSLGTILVFAAVVGGQRFVLHASVTHPEQTTYEYDLVGLSIREHHVLLPPDIYPRQDLVYLQRLGTTGGFVDLNPLLWGGYAVIPPIVEGAKFDDLQQAWLKAVREHPDDYLRHRLYSSALQLGITGPEMYVYYTTPYPEWSGPMLFPQIEARIVQYTAIGTTGYFGGPLQLVWAYILALIVFAAVNLHSRRRTDVVLALLSVAMLLYSVEILFLSPAITYRYIYPAVTAGTVLSVVLVASTVSRLLRTVRRRH